MKTAPTELMTVNAQASVPAVMTPAHMLQIAVERGADLDQLQKFMDLADRYERAQSKKAFDAAFARFKSQAPKIITNKKVEFKSTSYMHATLDNVCDAIVGLLAELGFTHRWKTTQDGARITVECILTHVDGHSESESLSSAPDDSGGKNSIQAIVSARSYLERHTLLGITGLAVGGTDNDGRGDQACIGPGQVADLEALISEIGVNLAAFLHYMKVDCLESIPLNRYKVALSALEAKRAHP